MKVKVWIFEKKTHCFRHKTKEHYKDNNPKCEIEGCLERPFYTELGNSYPKRCESHKFKEDINIIEKECSNCNLKYFIPKNRKMCNICHDYNQNKKQIRKEEQVKEFLERRNIKFLHDITFQDEITRCSRRRPDFVIDKCLYNIIIEVDENQHKSYVPECEISRMKEIYFDYGGSKNIVFFRMNPDNYRNEEGQLKRDMIGTRNNKIYEYLKYYDDIKEIQEPIVVYYFYYDGFNQTPKKLILDPYH